MRRNYSISAFNGYRRAWSDYSIVECKACGRQWRTKAKYVGELPDEQEDRGPRAMAAKSAAAKKGARSKALMKRVRRAVTEKESL